MFSSSACVYGEPRQVPIREDHPLHALNPYGSTKVVMEGIMADTAKAGEFVPSCLDSAALLALGRRLGVRCVGTVLGIPYIICLSHYLK